MNGISLDGDRSTQNKHPVADGSFFLSSETTKISKVWNGKEDYWSESHKKSTMNSTTFIHNKAQFITSGISTKHSKTGHFWCKYCHLNTPLWSTTGLWRYIQTVQSFSCVLPMSIKHTTNNENVLYQCGKFIPQEQYSFLLSEWSMNKPAQYHCLWRLAKCFFTWKKGYWWKKHIVIYFLN